MFQIAFIIPTFNRKQDLTNILNDISNLTKPNGLEVRSIVVVDGSTDGTVKMLRSKIDQPVDIIEGGGDWWYTKSINEGLKLALEKEYDFVITINDDCRINQEYLENIYSDYRSLEPGSIVGSVSYSIEEPTRMIFSGVDNIIWWRYKEHYYVPKGKTVDPDSMDGLKKTHSLPGRGILIPLETLKKVGIFDESFIQYGSDTEYIFRANKMDIDIQVSWNAKVFTFLGKTGKGSIHSNESVLTFIKNFFNPYSRTYMPNTLKILKAYGVYMLIPLTFPIKVLGHIKNYILKTE